MTKKQLHHLSVIVTQVIKDPKGTVTDMLNMLPKVPAQTIQDCLIKVGVELGIQHNGIDDLIIKLRAIGYDMPSKENKSAHWLKIALTIVRVASAVKGWKVVTGIVDVLESIYKSVKKK